VTSHGVTAGLVGMMVQSAVAVLTAQAPSESPSFLLTLVNRFVWQYVRVRMRDDDYMPITLFRSDGPGTFVFAGAHLDIAIRRARTGTVEWVKTPGTWVGAVSEIEGRNEDGRLTLDPGDVMVLYTDGLTEAKAADGRMFDLDGLARVVSGETGGAKAICDKLLQSVKEYMAVQADDITVLAVERGT